MRPERAARWVGRWVRLYTRELPAPVANRRIEEIDADLHDQIEHERARGSGERRIALALLARMARGLGADAAWRGRQAKASTAYRLALALAIGAAFILVWMVGAVGVIGTEGDRADMMYAGVLAVGIVGAIAGRFRAGGMARALLATALAQALVTAIALLAGKHQSPVTSVYELVTLNAFFVALFTASAWLFRSAARKRA